jgi:hypothetical protein
MIFKVYYLRDKIRMNYLGESIVDKIAADGPIIAPVVVVAPRYGQLVYSPSTSVALLTSGQLSTSTYNRLLTQVPTVSAPYYVQTSSGITTPDNIAFELGTPGLFSLRYKVGIVSDFASPQSISLILKINNIFVEPSKQTVNGVSNGGITYHDFEYLFSTTTLNERVYLYAKAETASTALNVLYLNFNVVSL